MRPTAVTDTDSVWRVLGTMALLVAVVASGVALALALGPVATPSIERIDAEFGDTTDDHTEVRTDLIVDAPLGTGPLTASADYTVTMNGITVAEGREDDVSLEPGRSTVSTSTHLPNDRIPAWWASHVDAGERTTVVADATVSTPLPGRNTDVRDRRTIETDILAPLASNETRPVEADLPLVDGPVLFVTGTQAAWGAVDEERTELAVDVETYNPTAFDVSVTGIEYTIRLNDVVVGEGDLDRTDTLESNTETTLAATVDIETGALEAWWPTHVENDQVSTLEVVLEVRVLLPTGETTTVTVDPFPDATVTTAFFDEDEGEAGSVESDSNRVKSSFHAVTAVTPRVSARRGTASADGNCYPRGDTCDA